MRGDKSLLRNGYIFFYISPPIKRVSRTLRHYCAIPPSELRGNALIPPPTRNEKLPPRPRHQTKRSKFSLRIWRGRGGSSREEREVWRVGMTDFATQNLVNSGSAALPSFQEGVPSFQGLLPLSLQGLPYPNVNTQKSESSSRRRTTISSNKSLSARET